MTQRYTFGELRKMVRGLQARGCASEDLRNNVRAFAREHGLLQPGLERFSLDGN